MIFPPRRPLTESLRDLPDSPSWPWPDPNPRPHTCPVCHGKGTVAMGFYSHTPFRLSDNTQPEQCRTCHGRGIVWAP
jgi:hypothetical protein